MVLAIRSFSRDLQQWRYLCLFIHHHLLTQDTRHASWMPPTDKAKAAGVSVTSFFDLKAELSKKSDEFARTKAAGGPKYIAGEGRTRLDKVRAPRLR